MKLLLRLHNPIFYQWRIYFTRYCKFSTGSFYVKKWIYILKITQNFHYEKIFRRVRRASSLHIDIFTIIDCSHVNYESNLNKNKNENLHPSRDSNCITIMLFSNVKTIPVLFNTFPLRSANKQLFHANLTGCSRFNLLFDLWQFSFVFRI